MPDLAPIDDSEWPSEIADMRGGFATRLNVYRTMAHNPALVRAWSDLRNHLVLHSSLTDQQSEIVILRIGVRKDSAYEWAHHVVRGLAAGLDWDRIERTRSRPVSNVASSTELDELLMAAVDALVDDNALEDELYRQLSGVIGKRSVFDLMATVGMYTTLAFILKTFEVPIEDDIAAELDESGLA